MKVRIVKNGRVLETKKIREPNNTTLRFYYAAGVQVMAAQGTDLVARFYK